MAVGKIVPVDEAARSLVVREKPAVRLQRIDSPNVAHSLAGPGNAATAEQLAAPAEALLLDPPEIDYLIPEPIDDADDLPAAAVDGRLTVGAIRRAVVRGRDVLDQFLVDPAFQTMLDVLYALPPGERRAFVRDQLVDEFERGLKGVTLPENVRLRAGLAHVAVLFTLTYELPEVLHMPWHNVTVSFGTERPERPAERLRLGWQGSAAE